MNWKSIDKTEPNAYETGDWDGKRSDWVLVSDAQEEIHVARCYSGRMDGTEFCAFYDKYDYEVENVVYWSEIELP